MDGGKCPDAAVSAAAAVVVVAVGGQTDTDRGLGGALRRQRAENKR